MDGLSSKRQRRNRAPWLAAAWALLILSTAGWPAGAGAQDPGSPPAGSGSGGVVDIGTPWQSSAPPLRQSLAATLRRRARVGPSGSIRLGVATCQPICGRLTVSITANGGAARSLHIAAGRVHLVGGHSARVKLKLGAAGRRLLRRRHRITAMVSETLVGPRGRATVTRRITLTLTWSRPPRHRRA